MFILYSVLFGLLAGLAFGGRPTRLADLKLRWQWLFIGGLVVQLVLFSGPVSAWIGDLGPTIYVASTAAVFGAVVANWRIAGIPIVALGAASNLVAIVANGGYMPADPGAMAALGKSDPAVYSNSSIVAHPALQPLTDVFALPSWLPFANVFSPGDVIISIGVVVTLVVAMRRRGGAIEQLPQTDEAPGTPGP